MTNTPCQVAFTIPLKPLSWNALVRKHYRTVTALADEWKNATAIAARAAHIPRIPDSWYPLSVSFHAEWTYRKVHDIDSLYLKPVLDALKAVRIVPDDSLAYISHVEVTGAIGAARDALTVTIRPLLPSPKQPPTRKRG